MLTQRVKGFGERCRIARQRGFAMFSYARRFIQKKFIRNVAIVATGAAGAQAVTMAFAPIITRLYGPEAFGVLGTFMAILAVVTPLAAFSYPIAIVLPKKDSDALGLAKLSVAIALFSSLLATVVLLSFRAPVVVAFNLQAVESVILLLPLAMFFSACMAVISQWVIRKKLFKIKAKVAVLQSLWLNSTKAGVGVFIPVATVLVVLASLGAVLHVIMLYIGIKKNTVAPFSDKKYKLQERSATFQELLFRHRDFAFYQTPQLVMNSLSHSLPVVMIASLYGAAPAGYYTLAKTVIMLPSALIGTAVGDVFYPRIAEAARSHESLHKIVIKATGLLAAIGLAPLVVLLSLGPALFEFVFGDGWRMSGEFARWLAPWVFLVFMNAPSVKAVMVCNGQKVALLINVFTTLLRVSGILIGYLVFDSVISSIILYSLAGIIHNTLFIFYAIGISKHFNGIQYG